jgi:hypothetical protein
MRHFKPREVASVCVCLQSTRKSIPIHQWRGTYKCKHIQWWDISNPVRSHQFVCWCLCVLIIYQETYSLYTSISYFCDIHIFVLFLSMWFIYKNHELHISESQDTWATSQITNNKLRNIIFRSTRSERITNREGRKLKDKNTHRTPEK